MAAHLILVRHSISKQRADVSSHQWELTAEGRGRCEALAERLRNYEPGLIASSAEPKARQTTDLVASRLGLEASVLPELASIVGSRSRGWPQRTSSKLGFARCCDGRRNSSTARRPGMRQRTGYRQRSTGWWRGTRDGQSLRSPTAR